METESNKSNVPSQVRAAFEVQNDFAAASTLESKMVWDVLGPDQDYILKMKLEYLFPDDKTNYSDKVELRRATKYNSQRLQMRRTLFENIWDQRKYTNGVLLHSIIYVIVTEDLDFENAKYSHNYTFHPIFRTRRCLNSNSSYGCCMIFIDEQSRVYQNWNDFLNNNELPIGTLVAPLNGCYSLNESKEVQLEIRFTPAYHYQTLTAVDNAVSAFSFIAQAATYFNPLFSILTIGTKTYETIREYQKQSDKVEHGTASAGTTLVNLGGNIIGLTSSVASLSAHVARSTGSHLSHNATVSLQVINGVATLISCTKFINSTYDIFTKYLSEEENLTISDIAAFGSALVLLTHSVNNLALTTKLANENGVFMRSLLISTVKGSFTLIAGNIVRLGVKSSDLLRLANDIPYKDVMLKIHSIYKNLSYSGFLTTVAVLGAIAMEVAPGVAVQIMDKVIVQVDLVELEKHFGPKFVQRIANSSNLIDILNVMGIHFSEIIIQFIMKMARQFIDTMADTIDENHYTFITTEMILYKMFSHAVKNYEYISHDYLNQKREDLMTGVTQYFQSFNPRPTKTNMEPKHDCKVCGGYFYLT